MPPAAKKRYTQSRQPPYPGSLKNCVSADNDMQILADPLELFIRGSTKLVDLHPTVVKSVIVRLQADFTEKITEACENLLQQRILDENLKNALDVIRKIEELCDKSAEDGFQIKLKEQGSADDPNADLYQQCASGRDAIFKRYSTENKKRLVTTAPVGVDNVGSMVREASRYTADYI